MIEAIELTVRRRGRNVLDAVSFDVRPGQVTGVLGGTGAGKTTLLRRMVDLERGGGETLFDGTPYRSLRHPMREIGLLLEPGVGHPQRTVRGHLRLALATDRRAAREGSGSVIGTGAGAGAWHSPKNSPNRTARRITRATPATSDPPIDGTGGRNRYGSPEHESLRASPGRPGPYSPPNHAGLRGFPDRRDWHGPAEYGGWHGPPERGSVAEHWWRLTDRLVRSRSGSPAQRIDAVLDIVGLTEQAETRLADLTDGMATRLGIAVALLGDPKTLLFDAPERGLEPEGLAWLGALLRAFTGQGRAALVTGSDTETLVGLADRILLLDSGYLVGTRTAEEVLRAPTGAAVIVRSPQIVRFAAVLTEAGARSAQGEGACLEVRGLDRARVGDLAYRHSIPVHELSERFTGSDPGDVVLAACSGRSRPIVPLQAFPESSGVRLIAAPPKVEESQAARSSAEELSAGRMVPEAAGVHMADEAPSAGEASSVAVSSVELSELAEAAEPVEAASEVGR